MNKISVNVTSMIDEDGLIKPQSLLYEDEEYLVDRILSVRPLNSLKSGGSGEGYCFKCVISGRAVSLIYNDVVQRWQMNCRLHDNFTVKGFVSFNKSFR